MDKIVLAAAISGAMSAQSIRIDDAPCECFFGDVFGRGSGTGSFSAEQQHLDNGGEPWKRKGKRRMPKRT